jgi:drug/metabolite transporter (DMT)-like permease
MTHSARGAKAAAANDAKATDQAGPVRQAGAGATGEAGATNSAGQEARGATDRLIVAGLAVTTVGLLAVGWIVSGALVADSTPALAVAVGRTAGSFFTLAIIAAMSANGRAAFRVLGRRSWIVIQLALLGYFFYFGGTMLGVARIGASRAGLVVALMPCITFVVGMIGFGERATLRKSAGTVTAVAAAVGYAAVTQSGPDHNTGLTNLVVGVGFTLFATLTFAIYGYAYKSRLHDVSPVSALAVLFGVATLLLLPAAAATVPLGSTNLTKWLGAFLLGAVLTAPVYITGHELFLRRGPLFVAAIALVVPFLVRIGDWALGNASAPDVPSMAFMALCLGGVVAVVR